MKYAKENDIINEENWFGLHPLFYTIKNENIKMIKLLIEYARETNNVLQLNEKNNIEMAKLLIEYAKENNITLS